MPSFLAVVNKRHDSPRAAIFYHVTLALLFALVGQTAKLINYLAFAIWVQRACSICALLYIRLSGKPVHPGRVRAPLLVPVLFLLICLALVGTTVYSDFRTASVGLAFLLAGFLFYLVFLWDRMLLRHQGYRDLCSRVNGKFMRSPSRPCALQRSWPSSTRCCSTAWWTCTGPRTRWPASTTAT